jgi:hypothetical protein
MRKQTEKPLFPFWAEDRGLSFFLAFLVLMTIFVPMVRLSRYGRIGVDLIFALLLFSGAVATIRKRILMYLIMALTLLEFTADLIVEFKPSFGYWGWDTALKIAGLAILVVMTLKHTLRPGPVSVHRGEPSPFIYFSFSVLTSVGFGDAYPVYRVARSLATAEALIGQLYPAILIATLVGMSLQARSSAGPGG